MIFFTDVQRTILGMIIVIKIARNQKRLDEANGYGEIWTIVGDSVDTVLEKRRRGMMLFLDDMPPQIGAYHPLGTNNIVLNRVLVQGVWSLTTSMKHKNAFIYVLLLHEYLHALGYVAETRVRRLAYQIAQGFLGECHVATNLAKTGPWSLLKDFPLDMIGNPRLGMEVVRDFDANRSSYIA